MILTKVHKNSIKKSNNVLHEAEDAYSWKYNGSGYDIYKNGKIVASIDFYEDPREEIENLKAQDKLEENNTRL